MIKDMTLQEVEAREAEIMGLEGTTSEEETRALLDEMKELQERKAELHDIETRAKQAEAVNHGAGITVDETEEREEKKMFNRESAEYRDAFYAMLQGTATEEQRSTLATVATEAIQIPKSLDDKIWDNIHTEHPILADIDTKVTGVILEVNKHTAITAGGAAAVNEGVANALENNTWAKVTLVGQDYSKTVELSYAAAKMSQGALEDYLAEEIAADLGDALAAAVFAQIKTDLGAAAVTVAAGAKLTYDNMGTAFGAVARGNNLKVYCSRAKKYGAILGMVDNNKQPVFRDGVAMGADVREDAAAGTDIFVLDPTKFVLNVVEPIMVESDRDIKAHKIAISGYCRAQGCMRDNGAGAYITFSA